MSAILRVENLTKRYRNGESIIEALKQVTLSLERGELLAVMGSSGSGKSTLLHILGALDEPDEGKIYLNQVHERNYCKEPHATSIRSQYIGFIFQQYNLLNDLNVEENIALPLILEGCRERIVRKLVEDKLKLVGLTGREHNRTFELSGGQQQRVAIARALITGPRILLADEPTGNLDYNTAIEIMELLFKMNKELGQSTIIVTHDPMVASYADRVVFFHDGTVKDEYYVQKSEKDISNILDIFRNLAIA